MNLACDYLFALIRTNLSADQMRRFASSCSLRRCCLQMSAWTPSGRLTTQRWHSTAKAIRPTRSSTFCNCSTVPAWTQLAKGSGWLHGCGTRRTGRRWSGQYSLNPDQVASAIAAFPAVPPLALDPDLLLAARQHATDMAVHNYQSHTGSDGSTPTSRVEATHYDGFCREENARTGIDKSGHHPRRILRGLGRAWTWATARTA